MAVYISSSERAAFRSCRYRWYWAYMRRVKPIRTAPALRFGTLIHGALELYYKKGVRRGANPVTTFEELYEHELKEQTAMGFRDEDGTWSEAGELGVAMLKHYQDFYGRDDEWKVLFTEHRFEVPILSPKGNNVGTYVGVIDLGMEHRPTGAIEIWDHKAVKSIDTRHLHLDSQKSGYWTYGVDALIRDGILKDALGLRSFRYNFLRKAKPDEREYRLDERGVKIYLNQNGTDSKVQPSPHFVRHPVPMTENERELERLMVLGELRDMRLVRAGKLDMYKNPGKFTCGFCDARDICEIHQVGGDYEEMAALTTKPKREWTPVVYKEEAIEDELEERVPA